MNIFRPIPLATLLISLTIMVGNSACSEDGDEGALPPIGPAKLQDLFRSADASIRCLSFLEIHRDKKAINGAYSRRLVYMDEGGSAFQDLSHGDSSTLWTADPFRKISCIAPQSVRTYFPFYNAFMLAEVKEVNRPPLQLFGSYLLATGIWPCKKWVAPNLQGHSFLLCDLARQDVSLSVDPRPRKQAGTWCHVVRHDDWDTLVVDTARGCCIVERTFRKVAGIPFNACFEMKGHLEVAPGVWLPTRVDMRIWDDEALIKGDQAGESYITDLQVNQPQSFSTSCECEGRAGVLRLRTGERPVQLNGGGYDVLDRFSNYVKNQASRVALIDSIGTNDLLHRLAVVFATLLAAEMCWRIGRYTCSKLYHS
jgi:hypothetical protein